MKPIQEVSESLDTHSGCLLLDDMYAGVEVPLLLPLD